MTVAPATPPPPKEPYILEDGGIYLEPFYWLVSGEPRLRGGLQAPDIADVQYNGKLKPAEGFELGIPAGRSNTITLTGFRVDAESNITLSNKAIVFGQQYYAGYVLGSTYKAEGLKLSWNYLSYTWRTAKTNIHLKTLYEVQYLTSAYNSNPISIPAALLSSGNLTGTSGSKNVILPTFGLAIGSQFSRFFRWEVRASGMGLPHRSDLGDLEALIAVRVSRIEIVGGEKFIHFKTNPETDMYGADTLQGVYGGLRFVWNGIR